MPFFGELRLPTSWRTPLPFSCSHPVVLAVHNGSQRPFSRQDISGFGKVLWVILLIVLPYIGIFAYILTQGGGMAERNPPRMPEWPGMRSARSRALAPPTRSRSSTG